MTREETFLNMALDYKKKYKECAWWKFRKRNELYKSWQSALQLMMRYVENKPVLKASGWLCQYCEMIVTGGSLKCTYCGAHQY